MEKFKITMALANVLNETIMEQVPEEVCFEPSITEEDKKFVITLTGEQFFGTVEIRKSGRVAWKLGREVVEKEGIVRFSSWDSFEKAKEQIEIVCGELFPVEQQAEEAEKQIAGLELTKLEKATIRRALEQGYAYDDANRTETNKHPFICWGFDGKQERGAVANLVRKGVLVIQQEPEGTYVYANFTVAELEVMAKEETEEVEQAEEAAPRPENKKGKNEIGHINGTIADLLDKMFLKGVTKEELDAAGITHARYRSHFHHLETTKSSIVNVTFENGVFKAELVK